MIPNGHVARQKPQDDDDVDVDEVDEESKTLTVAAYGSSAALAEPEVELANSKGRTEKISGIPAADSASLHLLNPSQSIKRSSFITTAATNSSATNGNTTKMTSQHHSKISSGRLHCCLIMLLLFILIFLSLPLLMIRLANTDNEETQESTADNLLSNARNSEASPLSQVRHLTQQKRLIVVPSTYSPELQLQIQRMQQQLLQQQQSLNSSTTLTDSELAATTTMASATATTTTSSSSTAAATQSPAATIAVLTCAKYAQLANLSLADENGHCPTATFPCQSCPDICIEQRRNCNGIPDCPDRSDERESSCHDSNGAAGSIFSRIIQVAAKRKQQQRQQQQQQQSQSGGASPTSPSLAMLDDKELAIPETCSVELFKEFACPCVDYEPKVIICENLGKEQMFSSLKPSVYKIRMGNNFISSLDNVSWPESLASLVLYKNRVSHLSNGTFKSAPNLANVYMENNEIEYIELDAFEGSTNLIKLQLDSNRLTTFDSRMLLHTPKITRLYLTDNQINLPNETSFSHCQLLRDLTLDHNKITHIKSHWFSNMSSLFWLSLTYNEIEFIEDGSFNWNYDLEELNLSNNRIKHINRKTFFDSLNIQQLHLGYNPLEPLPVDAFREIVQMRSLNLTNVVFKHIELGTFTYLSQLDFIYFSKFRYCHYAPQAKVCLPHTDGLSSQTELLAVPILKHTVRIVAFVCSLGNVFVFIWRTISSKEDRLSSLFVRNLAIADLMMGIYLCTIGYQDYALRSDHQNFGDHAIEWINSWKCTAIGFLAILSSELSVFILTIITIDRYRSIRSMKNIDEHEQERRARIYVLIAWLVSFAIASYPLLRGAILGHSSDYYATNGLCLPLHIDNPYAAGYEYSAFVYLFINFSAVLLMIALYLHMYLIVMANRKSSGPTTWFDTMRKKEDAILALRFFFIVVTDCSCWIPIVVIKVVALFDIRISYSIYGWLVVFIIPINSALNPIVYTLSAQTSLRARVFQMFEAICNRVDQMTSRRSSSLHNDTDTNQATGAPRRLLFPAPDWLSWKLKPNKEIGSANGHQHPTSGSTDASCLPRRHQSNSTSCDTFETSIMSQPKTSLESGSIYLYKHYEKETAAAATTTTTTTTSSSPEEMNVIVDKSGGSGSGSDKSAATISLESGAKERQGGEFGVSAAHCDDLRIVVVQGEGDERRRKLEVIGDSKQANGNDGITTADAIGPVGRQANGHRQLMRRWRRRRHQLILAPNVRQ